MKRIFLTLTVLASGILAQAQNFVNTNFGENSLSDFNPASIMEDGSLVSGRIRYDWYGSNNNKDKDLYQENPLDVVVSGNAVYDWGGISAKVLYDEYSYFKCHAVQLNYSYRWKTGTDERNHFSLGGGLNMGINDIDLNKLRYDEGTVMRCTPDMNLGFEYSNGTIRTGIGAQNLLSMYVKVDGAKIIRNPRVILCYFMYRFNIKDVVGITPLIYSGYSEKMLVELDIRLDYKKIIYVSYGFRAMDLRHLLNINFNIPKTPVTLDLCFAGAEFYKSQAISAGITVHL